VVLETAKETAQKLYCWPISPIQQPKMRHIFVVTCYCKGGDRGMGVLSRRRFPTVFQKGL